MLASSVELDTKLEKSFSGKKFSWISSSVDILHQVTLKMSTKTLQNFLFTTFTSKVQRDGKAQG